MYLHSLTVEPVTYREIAPAIVFMLFGLALVIKAAVIAFSGVQVLIRKPLHNEKPWAKSVVAVLRIGFGVYAGWLYFLVITNKFNVYF